MTIERYQFGRPGKLAGGVEDQLRRWFKAASALAPAAWEKALPFPVGLSFGGCGLAPAAEALAALPTAAVAYRVLWGQGLTTLLALPRPLVLALVAGLLGDGASDPVIDRELTPVEDNLCQFFIQDLLLPPLRRAWPGPALPALELGAPELNPQWSRLFLGAGALLDCTFTVEGPFGEEKGHWLIPHKHLPELFGNADAPRAAAAKPAANLDELVRGLPVEIKVRLGTVEISLHQLARLRVGDLLVLSQRVAEPLTASVGDGKKLRVWAGRVGACKAFQVDSLGVGD
jgi:flagellar motor switch protein FliM